MESKLIALIAPIVTSVITFALTHLYYRREKQNDLEAKLTARIEDLTLKIIALNDKYITAMYLINNLKFENEQLKTQIKTLEEEKYK
jgi:cell division protein FtsB